MAPDRALNCTGARAWRRTGFGNGHGCARGGARGSTMRNRARRRAGGVTGSGMVAAWRRRRFPAAEPCRRPGAHDCAVWKRARAATRGVGQFRETFAATRAPWRNSERLPRPPARPGAFPRNARRAAALSSRWRTPSGAPRAVLEIGECCGRAAGSSSTMGRGSCVGARGPDPSRQRFRGPPDGLAGCTGGPGTPDKRPFHRKLLRERIFPRLRAATHPWDRAAHPACVSNRSRVRA